MKIASALALSCGGSLSNRLAKGAMTEGLATTKGLPTPELERLYSLWSQGGAGILLTGNVQVDRDHLERPGNVIIDREPDAEMREALRRWAKAGTERGNHLWMQISHAGRQTPALINKRPKAPSAVKLGLPGGQFGQPVAITEDEIVDLIERFAMAAAVARETGFTGVQIHAAHGYLISSFLNPLANVRADAWGGSLDNRARLLMETVSRVRTSVGRDFPISVKLNSADFQRGGFAFEDSLIVARKLQDAGIDLLEISGGSYEQPAMMDMEGLEPADRPKVAASTAQREAYFVDFAKSYLVPRMIEDCLMMTREQRIAIMRNFPVRADIYEAFHAVKSVIDRAPPVPSDAALRRLIGSLKLIYRRYANQPITMTINCPFVALVAAAAEARGWSAAGLRVRDIEEQMRPRRANERYGRRATRLLSAVA